MFDNILKHADIPERPGMSAIFILSGASKTSAPGLSLTAFQTRRAGA
ncbi:MAG: hypothetical protein U1E46_18640 [Hyphomicrobiales bacterium]